MTFAEIVDELSRSKVILEAGLAQPVRYLSYPFGAFDERVTNVADLLGYQAAFTIDDYRGRQFDPFYLRRTIIRCDDNLRVFRWKISPLYLLLRRKLSRGNSLARYIKLHEGIRWLLG